MSDKISRQAAIAKVEKESNVDGAYGYMDTKSIVDLLEDLPPAEPDIIHCRDCENLKIDGIYHDCWCDGRKVWLDFYCGNAKRKMEVEHEKT